MKRRVVVRPQARLELAAASDWYDEHASGIGDDLLRAFETTVATLEQNPFRFQVIHRNLRRAGLGKFPYGLLHGVGLRHHHRRLHSRQPRSEVLEKPRLTPVVENTMPFPDLVPSLREKMPDLRGRLLGNEPLAAFTWFRVGGPAQVLFMPDGEDDLAYFLTRLPSDIPVTVVGLGSNLIVRDGGVPGVVIRLGRGFSEIVVEPGHRIRAGTAVPDVKVSRAAQDAGIAGLAFFRGIPGAIGGALRMNGGAYGGETKDVLLEARGVDRAGRIHVFANPDMHYTYRHCGVSDDVIFTQALFQGTPGDPAEIAAAMEKITESREATQPIKSRTGGSTFKNPPGQKAWQLVDAAGCRGLVVGDAQVSELHCNFLINRGSATAADIENLGETVRRRVKETSGVELEWEIKRIGIAG